MYSQLFKSFRAHQAPNSYTIWHSIHPYLPLSLLSALETLKDVNLGLQRLQPSAEVGRNLCLIVAKLSIEVLAIWTRGHGGGEDWLNQEAVVWLQGVAVGVAEGDGELVGWALEVGGDGEAGEFKSTISISIPPSISWDIRM